MDINNVVKNLSFLKLPLWGLVTGMSIRILVEGHQEYYAWAIAGLLYAAITAIFHFPLFLFDKAVEQGE